MASMPIKLVMMPAKRWIEEKLKDAREEAEYCKGIGNADRERYWRTMVLVCRELLEDITQIEEDEDGRHDDAGGGGRVASKKLSAEERWDKLRELLKEYKRASRERILTADEKVFLFYLVEANAFDEALGLMDLLEDKEWQHD